MGESAEMRKSLLILYSSGDLGDVGRHCVLLALRHPLVERVRVISNQPPALLFDDISGYTKCSCPPNTHQLLPFKDRLELHSLDPSRDDLLPHVMGADVVISCLGNRQPFHPDAQNYCAKNGTENLVASMLNFDDPRRRLVQLSSVGIGNDWPPLPGHREGSLLAGFFRTICWHQFQDLSGAERAVHRAWSSKQLDFVTVRCAILPDEREPQGSYRVALKSQERGGQEVCSSSSSSSSSEAAPRRTQQPIHEAAAKAEGCSEEYDVSIAKLDAAMFLINEAVEPTLHRQVVILGGAPVPSTESHAGISARPLRATNAAATAGGSVHAAQPRPRDTRLLHKSREDNR